MHAVSVYRQSFIFSVYSFCITELRTSFHICLFFHFAYFQNRFKVAQNKMESSRLRLVFLDCCLLMSHKEYRTDVKHRPKGSNLFTEATQLSLLWQR